MQNKYNDVVYSHKLFFYDCIWEGNEIIYPAVNCEAICKTDITTGETVVMDHADTGKGQLLFYGIYKWKEYLILPDRNIRMALVLFNIKKNEWSSIPVEECLKEYLNFREEYVLEYKGYLYIFSWLLVILKVGIEKRSIEYLYYPDIKPEKDRRGEIVIIGNIVYIPVRHNNRIYKFNLDSEQWDTLTINTDLKGIDTLCFDGKLFWMTGIGKMVCSWDEENNTSVSYKKFPTRFKKLVSRAEEGFWFHTSVVYNDFIYFIPSEANMVIEFDIRKCEANEFFIEDEWEDEEDTRIGRYSVIKYMGAKRKDNILMLLSNKNKNLIFIDLETKGISKTELKMCARNGADKLILRTPVMQEGVLDLETWTECISIGKQQYNIKEKNMEETIGKKIYSFIEC